MGIGIHLDLQLVQSPQNPSLLLSYHVLYPYYSSKGNSVLILFSFVYYIRYFMMYMINIQKI
jgi:hypothetical protein